MKFILPLFLLYGCALAPTPGLVAPSSKIPERREFPINASVNPCEDFHKYACSKVEESFTLREDRSMHTFSFDDSEERLLNAKMKYLAALPSSKNLSPRAQQLNNVYSACMNVEGSKKEEKEFVPRIISKVLSMKTREEFQLFLGDQIDGTEFGFLYFSSDPNQNRPEWNDLIFDSGLQSLPERSYYDDPKLMKEYREVVEDLFRAAGLDQPRRRAEESVAFEKEFAQTYPLPREIRDRYHSPSGIRREELLKKYPALKLGKVLKRIPARTHIRHLFPESFEFLNQALQSQPLETLESVYLFHSLQKYMDDAFPETYRKRFEFNHKYLGGPPKRTERPERCAQYMIDAFGRELDAEMLPLLFPNFPKEKFVSLAEKVRQSLLKGIRENKWLSSQAKKAAKGKMANAKLHLVSPNNDAEWDFNPPADYLPDHPYRNSNLLTENLINKKIRELAVPRDRNRWELSPLTVNAYYQWSDNKFVMPIGILQYPFYDPALSDEINLGAVGAVIGHELGHGIDDSGSKYDAKGRMKQWMTAKDLTEFKQRGSKLVEQFNRIGHDGRLTLGENIGDLVGLTFAYRAAFPKEIGTRESKEAFYVQYARNWCFVVRPKFRENLMKTNEHPMPDARINEQVKQQPAFQEAFHCKAGDPMVLDDAQRVTIW